MIFHVIMTQFRPLKVLLGHGILQLGHEMIPQPSFGMTKRHILSSKIRFPYLYWKQQTTGQQYVVWSTNPDKSISGFVRGKKINILTLVKSY